MKYLLLIYDRPDAYPAVDSPEYKEVETAFWSYQDALEKAGVLVDSKALQDVEQARSVSVRNGNVNVTDGPYIETKEHISGYFLIETASMEEATEWAAKNPGATYGAVEIRPIFVFAERP